MGLTPDPNPQSSHLPMPYDVGRPKSVIRFRIWQPRMASLSCPAGLLGAKTISDDRLVSKERVLRPRLTHW